MSSILGTLAVKVRADTAQFQSGMAASQKAMQGFSSRMLALSGAVTAVGGILTGLGVKSIRTAANFEAGMARVRAVSQAIPSDFNAMRQAALDLAAGTKFSATEVSEGMKFMAMAGMKTKEIMGGIPSVLDLAAAGAIEMGNASDIVTNIMAGFGKQADELGSSVDVVVKAITSANVDVAQLGNSFKYVGPIARSAGVSFEETTAAIALMGNAGIQSTQAGTALRGALSRLLNPTSEVEDALNELHIKTKDSEGRLLSLTQIVAQLQPIANDSGRILQLFGDRAGPGMAVLLGAGSDALYEFTRQLQQSGGIAKSIAQSEMATFAGQMKILESRFEAVQISIGTALMPVAHELLGWAEKIAGWFQSLSKETKLMVFGFGAAGAAIGALAGVLVLLWPAITPLLILAGALAGIILYTGLVKKAWQSDFGYIRTATLTIVNGIKTAFNTLFDTIKSGVTTVLDFHLWLFRTIADGLRNLTGGRVDIDITTKNADEILDGLEKKAADAAKAGVEGAKNAAKGVASVVVDSMKEGVNSIASTLKGMVKGIVGSIPKTGGAGAGTGPSIAAAAAPAGPAVAPGTIAIAPVEPPDLSGMFADAFSKVGQQFERAALGSELEAQTQNWADAVAVANDNISMVFSSLGQGITSSVGAYLQSQTDATNAYLDSQVAAGKMTEEAAVAQASAAQASASKLAADTQAATDVMGAAVDGFARGGVLGALAGLFSSLFSKSSAFGKVMVGFGKIFSGLMKALSPLFNALGKALRPLIDALSPILAPLASLFQILQILVPIFKLVGLVFQVVGKVLYVFASVIAAIWNFLLDIVASIVGIFSESTARDIRKMKIDMKKELSDEENTTATDKNTEATQRNTDQVNTFSDTVAEVNEELGNVPDAFKIANARYNAMDATEPTSPGGSATSAGAFSGATINVYAQDPEEAYDRLQDAAGKRSFEAYGTTVVRGPPGAREK